MNELLNELQNYKGVYRRGPVTGVCQKVSREKTIGDLD